MSWDPGQYLRFTDERNRPAMDLLARVPLDVPARIIDLGCGPGNSTALLAARFPRAALLGVDSSREMLARARREGPPNSDWLEADAGSFTPAVPPDLIFSNALFQWVPDHAPILARLLGTLAPGGVLAVQMPRNFDAPSHRAIREVAAESPWAAVLKPLIREDPVAGPEKYFAALHPRAASLDLWETEYCHALSGEHPVLEWVKGTALRPLLAVLDSHHRDVFLSHLAERLARAYPRRDDGVTLFPFRRLFIVATHSPEH
ncbi:MAG: trans-aconitate 2-methyltransferase [Alphaproteobacteria bacterium]|nr:trans-aconitate 2-methyltransferase [Alphaproteobacteria bacterium]